MSRATSSSVSSSYTKPRRRPRIDRTKLTTGFDLLADAFSPLPAALPSPPLSRASSPAPGSKRKMDSDSEDGHNKKPRTTTTRVSSTPRPTPSSAPKPGPSASSHPRYDPSEDGELLEDPPIVRREPESAFTPIRRPRRSKGDINWHELHIKYQQLGRNFKFSGDRRLASTFNSKNPNYRPLRRPPLPGSSYHSNASILARLELLDGLLCFAYAFFCTDLHRGRPNPADWITMASYMKHCKGQWPLDAQDDKEKALGALVWTVQSYIHGRVIYLDSESVWRHQSYHYQQLKDMWNAEKAQQEKALQSRATPPMLPSPASITTGSANSTPASRSTPIQKEATKPSESSQRPNSGEQEKETLPSHLTVPMNGITLERYRAHSSAVHDARRAMEVAQQWLNLPIIAKLFPRTFSRMIHTTYAAQDEHEPDFEDDEGELFWPPQVITGTGIGWLCHMGRAMLKEFGRKYGYSGAEELLSKQIEDAMPDTSETTTEDQNVSTPGAQDKR